MSEPTQEEVQKAVEVIEEVVKAETKPEAPVEKVIDAAPKSDKVELEAENASDPEKMKEEHAKKVADAEAEKKARFEQRLARIAGGSPR